MRPLGGLHSGERRLRFFLKAPKATERRKVLPEIGEGTYLPMLFRRVDVGCLAVGVVLRSAGDPGLFENRPILRDPPRKGFDLNA